MGTPTPRDSLRIVLLDSWQPDAHVGSGTAVGISTLIRGLEELGHRVEVIRPRRGAGSLLGRLAFNWTVPKRLAALGPVDLLVGFDLDGFRRTRVRQDTPYVVCLKGIAADEARFARSRRERWLLSVLARLERANALQADRVLVPSAYSARVAQQTYGIREDRIRIVPEPIDLAPWDALQEAHGMAERRPDRPTLLSVARQYPRKDTETLLHALSRVRNAIPDVHLRVIGGGPELPRLRTLAETLGLHGTVTFHGALPDDAAVRQAYRDAHVFCLPSLQEGFGIVFLEAMAAGLPIVAVHAGATPEVVADSESGLLVPPGDVEALAGAIERLLGDSGLRARMGSEGRRRVRRYDHRAVARAFSSAALGASNPVDSGAKA